MSRRASGLIAVALVLLTAFTATAALGMKRGKPVTPKLGRYYGQVVGQPKGGDVVVRETELKVVNLGKPAHKKVRRRGAKIRVSAFLATCSAPQVAGVGVLEKSPIPIKNGKFKLDRTTHPRIAGGAGTATSRTVVSGTFKSPTRVVVRVFISFSYTIQFPGQPEVKGTCTGRQTSIAKHRSRSR